MNLLNIFKYFSRNKEKSKDIYSCSVTNRGLVRNGNEDNFYNAGFVPNASDLERQDFVYTFNIKNYKFEIFAVFDGMGGMSAGEIASGTAAQDFRMQLSKIDVVSDMDELVKEIQNIIADMNELIYKKATSDFDYVGMGTTFVCLCIFDDKAVVLNVGDSRCYIYDQKVLELLSTDHTMAAENLRNNIITFEEAKNSKDNNKLTRFLGMAPEYGRMVSDSSEIISIKKGTRFLLCSDGLYGMVEEDNIAAIMKKYNTNECVEKLVSEALTGGGQDNITVTVVDIA